ncbi:MAG: YbjQ family protein [Phycisphaerales bacterium]|nr:MAG: YbjQ family protein [Phycisphaerales bacterium]
MATFWFQILPVVAFLILGFSIGTIVERAHFRRLARREAALSYMLLTDTKSIPQGCVPQPCGLVVGDVVIASDYFKTFVAGIRKIIGGELRTYETLLERARREAIVRMMESARAMGSNRVVNVRLSTSTVGSSQRRRRAAMVEIYAYGTAICVPDDPSR